jgi:hypothetical protein
VNADKEEAFRQWLLADPARIEQSRQWLAAKIPAVADSIPIEQRLSSARIWVWDLGEPRDDWDGSKDEGQYVTGAHPDLIVRCAEDNGGKPCGQRMARFWNTPFGHYGEVRKAPGGDADRFDLDLARRAREEGDELLARMAEYSVGKPTILPTLLEDFVESGFEVAFGCSRRHGNMSHPVDALIGECDSPRRKLHLYPVRWRDALD